MNERKDRREVGPPKRPPRQGWEAAFEAARETSAREDDASDFETLKNEFADAGWTWDEATVATIATHKPS